MTAAILAFGTASAQAAPSFSVPVECQVGPVCVVQNYVDRDPGPEARDYRCGFLTYDGHKGTDIRVIDPAALRRGIAVVAASAGRVHAVRDGMADVNVRAIGKESVAGREAGNSVIVEHGDGWETQYGHMRNGSIAVRPGDTVTAGQRLGLVGLSGYTEFPHVHFEVRHHGKTVDPFVGEEGGESCQVGAQPLWAGPALDALAYVATGLVAAGIAGDQPTLDDGRVAGEQIGRFTSASGAAVFWVQIYGARADDWEELRLFGPDGRVLAERRGRIARTRAQWLVYAGLHRSAVAWPPGLYRGEYALYRGPERLKVISVGREITVQ